MRAKLIKPRPYYACWSCKRRLAMWRKKGNEVYCPPPCECYSTIPKKKKK